MESPIYRKLQEDVKLRSFYFQNGAHAKTQQLMQYSLSVKMQKLATNKNRCGGG